MDVSCRYCGHRDDFLFCSQCGLALEWELATPWAYFKDRARMTVEPVGRFFFTVALLLFRAHRFFSSLSGKDVPVSRLGLLWGEVPPRQKITWRRPLSPPAYLGTIIIIFMLLADDLGSLEPARRSVRLIFNRFLATLGYYEPLPAYIQSVLNDISVAWLIWVVLVLLLFMYLTPYRVLLGIRPDRLKLLGDYLFYVSIQMVLAIILGLVVGLWALQQGIKDVSLLNFGMLALLIALSVYYYLVTPVRLWPAAVGVSRSRVVGCYFAMVLVICATPVSIPLFYFVYGMVRLSNKLARV